MPKFNNEDTAEEPAAVKQPETPAERQKRRLSFAVAEPDEDKSQRRHNELHVHHDAHMEIIKAIHEQYPAPVLFEKGQTYSDTEMANWNARRHEIDMANKAYYNAVRRTFAEHQAEDAHAAKVRAEGASK